MKKLLLLFILAASSLFAGEQISINATGVNITDAAADKVGFHGTAPVAQRTSSDQAAVTKGTGAALATTAATQTTPWGFATQAQADALTTRINQLVADNANLITLVNELRAAQVEKGLIKGS